MLIKGAKKFILDTIFPVFCIGCEKEGSRLCDECFKTISIKRYHVCHICEKEISEFGKTCKHCRAKQESPLDVLLPATDYENPLVKQLLYGLKYKFMAGNAKYLTRLMISALYSCQMPLPDMLVPVPLSKRRLRWRGYNQSDLLAQLLSKRIATPLEIPVVQALSRKKFVNSQMKIKKYEKRFENVRDNFELNRELNCNKLSGKKVLLIDDIATTGATLMECAKILKQNGAKNVYATVVARQALKK